VWYVLAGIVAGLGLLYWIARPLRLLPRAASTKPGTFKPPVEGLSEEQAARLQTGQLARQRQQLEKQARRANWRTSAISVFNLTMLVMAISQVWLNDPLGALATLGVLVLNISMNIFQQDLAAQRVSQVALQARPFATVVRESRLRSLSLDEIVIGDVLVAGPGDEILANGIILESRSLTIYAAQHPEENPLHLQKGDLVQAGSMCDSGQAVYRITHLPPVYPAVSNSPRKSASASGKTHLESILLRVLYLLLLLAGLLYTLLLIEVFRIDVMEPEQMRLARDVMGFIFGLAPTGFFLMIVVNYAKGTSDLARLGTLVRDKRSIETLADLTSLCIHQKTILSNLDVQTEMIPFRSGASALAENFVRRVLGVMSRSLAGAQVVLAAISDAFDGERRQPLQQAFFFSLNGWGAASFTYSDLRGTFVIGYPEILKPYLAASSDSASPASAQPPPAILARLRSRFARPQREPEPDQAPPAAPQDLVGVDPVSPDLLPPSSTEAAPTANGFFTRMRSSIQGALMKIRKTAPQKGDPPLETGSVLELLFAYLPEPVDLYDPAGVPRCPSNLIPVCQLHFKAKALTELADAVKTGRAEGIQIKFFVQETDGQIEARAKQIGLFAENDPNAVISAAELARMRQEELTQAIAHASLFKDLNRHQMALAVNLLRQSGETVGVLGGSALDLQSMRRASLAIVRQGSDQAILAQADIVLLKNHPDALRKTLARGQQIVHGILDVIKLNLVQIGYVLLLLLGMYLIDRTRFYYAGSQGSMAGLFTVTIPAILLSLWAPTGAVNQGSMRVYLTRFIIPPAVTIALAVLVLDWHFMSVTNDPVYTRLVITHALVSMGLMLVIFTRPITKWLAGGDRLTRDPRPTIMAGVLFLLWNGFVWIGLAQRFLFVAPLASLPDYLTVWTAALIWGIVTQLIWRLPWLNRSVDYLSSWLKSDIEIDEESEINKAQAQASPG